MKTAQLITASEIDGRTYYTATRAGVEYCAGRLGDAWYVSSRRLALGRFNTGGGKHYADLAAVAAGCKAFAGLDALVEAAPCA